MASPATTAATPKPRTGPVMRGLGMRHSVFTITSAVSVRTSALIAIRSADGSSEARAYTPIGTPRAPATATGVSSR